MQFQYKTMIIFLTISKFLRQLIEAKKLGSIWMTDFIMITYPANVDLIKVSDTNMYMWYIQKKWKHHY